MCCPLVFEFSVGIGGFVIGLGQISFFFSFIHIAFSNISAIFHARHKCKMVKRIEI